MNPQLTQSVSSLLRVILIASVVSSLIYFAFRLLSIYFKVIAQYASFPIVILIYSSFFLTSIFPHHDYNLLIFIALLASAGLIGGAFHKKSCDEPMSFFFAFILMSASSASSVFWFSRLLERNHFSLLDHYINAFFGNVLPGKYLSFFNFSEDLVWVFIVAQTITTPFLIWVWKSSRLRPGIDKHFDE